MCYKKPGPRCTAHARIALQKATAEYNANPNSFDAYKSLREAQDVYDQTPGGLKELQEKISSDSLSLRERFDLDQHLTEMKEKRQAALDAIKSQDHGDVDTHKSVSETQPLPESNLPASPFKEPTRYSATPYYDTYDTSYYNDYKTSFAEDSLAIGYDSYDCRDPEDCRKDYICRDKEYSGLRILKFNSRRYLADAYQVKPEQIPDEWVEEVDSINPEDHIEVHARGDYYGEVIEVNVSRELQQKVASLYYAQPNATDTEGALSYIREQGKDTTGDKPLEAVKKLVSARKRLPSGVRDDIRSAKSIQRQRVSLSKIKVSQSVMSKTERTDMSKTSSEAHAGGVLIRDPNTRGGYILLSGEDRVKGIQETTNKKTWQFLVLSSQTDINDL